MCMVRGSNNSDCEVYCLADSFQRFGGTCCVHRHLKMGAVDLPETLVTIDYMVSRPR
jgi:hypothetical protein